MRSSALSDIGKARTVNEDAFALLPDRGVYIVSDGMGGHRAGATASKIVVEALPEMIGRDLGPLPLEQEEARVRSLRDMVVALSQQIFRQSSTDSGLSGMGATVVVACVRGAQALIGHMGDSRAYLYRAKALRQLTEDHAVVSLLLRQGQITPEEAEEHPARGQLSRYVGMQGVVYPDVQTIELSAGDRLLLCTDGLTGMVPDTKIAQILEDSPDPEVVCSTLVDAANAAGGRDNVTVLLIDQSDQPECDVYDTG